MGRDQTTPALGYHQAVGLRGQWGARARAGLGYWVIRRALWSELGAGGQEEAWDSR